MAPSSAAEGPVAFLSADRSAARTPSVPSLEQLARLSLRSVAAAAVQPSFARAPWSQHSLLTLLGHSRRMGHQSLPPSRIPAALELYRFHHHSLHGPSSELPDKPRRVEGLAAGQLSCGPEQHDLTARPRFCHGGRSYHRRPAADDHHSARVRKLAWPTVTTLQRLPSSVRLRLLRRSSASLEVLSRVAYEVEVKALRGSPGTTPQAASRCVDSTRSAPAPTAGSPNGGSPGVAANLLVCGLVEVVVDRTVSESKRRVAHARVLPVDELSSLVLWRESLVPALSRWWHGRGR